MESLYLLIPIVFVIILLAGAAFFWAVRSGQYDDLDTEGHRILFEDPALPSSDETPKTQVEPSKDTEAKRHD